MPQFETLQQNPALVIRQRLELGEFLGFETRNKYQIETDAGIPVGFAAEQQKGLLGFLMRQFLGHWRRFDLQFFDEQRRPTFRATQPFRWLFSRLELRDQDGRFLGALQQRFALFHKRLDLEDELGRVVHEVRSPIWKPWTFEFRRVGGATGAVRGAETISARILKKWTGLFAEGFTDKDRFRLEYVDPELTLDERAILVAAALFIDLNYFEKKAS